MSAPNIPKQALAAIRSFCLACQGRSHAQVRECGDVDCPLHPFREAGDDLLAGRPLRVIRAYCLVCSGNDRHEVRACDARSGCSLWSFRFGVSPRTYRRVRDRRSKPKQHTLPGLKPG